MLWGLFWGISCKTLVGGIKTSERRGVNTNNWSYPMPEQKHVLTNTSVLQSSHKITYIFSASGKFIYSRNHIPSPSSSHRHCWDLWPCPFLSTLSVSDLISLDWRLSALPWPSAIVLCGDWVSPGDAGGVWVGGLRVKCFWTALLESPPARHTLSPPATAAVVSPAVRCPSRCHPLPSFMSDCQNDGLRVEPPLLRSQVCGLYDSHFPHRRHFFLFNLKVLDGKDD